MNEDTGAFPCAVKIQMAEPHISNNPPLVCWSCHERSLGTHFCSSCGKLVQLAPNIDYFAMLEMPRKLWVEADALERKFLQLSWKLHPDKYASATEQERELSLRHSSELNDAYRTLRDPIARVEYLLSLEGMRKEGETKQQAPAELLEEVFELNESLDELREARAAGGDLAGLKARLQDAEKSFQGKLGAVDAALQSGAREWDAALDAPGGAPDVRKKLLERMNELLNRRAYLRNLTLNVAKELAA
ncbi:MAG: Fe-S protein assembly co-chaperone HscB [Acidobacteriia bacterium]|nr:Fe-S protein assembly co-chaperone HscB [Terriglobia bacterium]